MVAFGEHNFKLNKRDEQGVSLRETLQEVERQTGRTPEELEGPDFPEVLGNVWSAFVALSNSRNPSFSGVAPITYEQIKAYCEVTHTPLSPQEIDAIKRLDNAYQKAMNE